MTGEKSVVWTTKQIVDEYLQVLLDSPVFAGFTREDLYRAAEYLDGRLHVYGKNEVIFSAGEKVRQIGVILQGHVDTVQEDYWGNQLLLGRFGPGLVFADSFVLADAQRLPFTASAYREAHVLMFDYERFLRPYPAISDIHLRMLKNLLSISAKKNIFLLQKMGHVTKRSVREKLLAYLSWKAATEGASCFTLPFNRQGLANYLGIDRSAMSTELGRMRRDGLIDYEKNTFRLLHREPD